MTNSIGIKWQNTVAIIDLNSPLQQIFKSNQIGVKKNDGYYIYNKENIWIFEEEFIDESSHNLQQIFDKLGINDDSEVLVYGFTMPEQGFGDEARVVYTFNYAGFENVKFIDGGFKQVEKLGFNKNYEPTKDRIKNAIKILRARDDTN